MFQGSNARTKTGTSAAQFLEDTSNAPASFAAARAALGLAALKGYDASLREADTAYLQAVIVTPMRISTFLELLRKWWPDSWFKDGAKSRSLEV